MTFPERLHYLFLSLKKRRKNGFNKRGGLNRTIFIQSSFQKRVALAALQGKKSGENQQNGFYTHQNDRRQKAGNQNANPDA